MHSDAPSNPSACELLQCQSLTFSHRLAKCRARSIVDVFWSHFSSALTSSSVSKRALSLVFLCSLAQGSFQLLVADHWLHALLARAQVCFRVQDVCTVLVDNVGTFNIVHKLRKLLDRCSVADDLSSVVSPEDCHRSSICTLLHRQDRPRCIRNLVVDSHFTSLASCEPNISPRTAVSQRFTTYTAQRQITFAQVPYWMQNSAGNTTEPESRIGRSSACAVHRLRVACVCRGWWTSGCRWQTSMCRSQSVTQPSQRAVASYQIIRGIDVSHLAAPFS